MKYLKYHAIKEIPHLTWGRTTSESDPCRLFWSGSALEINVSGSELYMDIENRYSLYENWADVEIDGAVTQHLMLPEGRHRIGIFRGMDDAQFKRIRLIRDTQAMHDDPHNRLTIYGLWGDGDFSAVDPCALRLEFVGDSLTTAEGLNGAGNYMDWNPGCMNFTRSFSYLVAKELKAEYRCVCQSGWGVVASWDGQRDRNLPSCYDQVVGVLTGSENIVLGTRRAYDFSSWRPDAVIINLGTNDTRPHAHVTSAELKTGVKQFLLQVRKHNPESQLIWAYGMCGQEADAAIREGVSQYQRETGDARVHYLLLPDTRPGEYGSREHPGPLVHARAAKEIASLVRELLH